MTWKILRPLDGDSLPDATVSLHWAYEELHGARFIADVLFQRESDSVACFSYYSLARTKIHNANLLGAIQHLASDKGMIEFHHTLLCIFRSLGGG